MINNATSKQSLEQARLKMLNRAQVQVIQATLNKDQSAAAVIGWRREVEFTWCFEPDL